jgi:hypothetical protein
LCTGVDSDVKVAADCAVAGLVFAAFGLGCLVTHSIKFEYRLILFASLAFWALAWVLLLASFAVFAGTIGKDTECKVEAESKQGAVIAQGKFGDIINGGGSYTYGFVIGSWLLTFVPIVLIALRIKFLAGPSPPPIEEPKTEPKVVEPQTAIVTETTVPEVVAPIAATAGEEAI